MRTTGLLMCAAVLATAAGCSKPQGGVAPATAPAAPAPAATATPPQTTPSAAAPNQAPSGTVADFQARYRRNVMRADADHDGRVSRQEWMTFRAAHPGKGGDPEKQFSRLDANHDGYVTPDEVDAVSARAFARRSAMQASAPAGEGNEEQ